MARWPPTIFPRVLAGPGRPTWCDHVVADVVALVEHPVRQLAMVVDVVAHQEERRLGTCAAQRAEHPGVQRSGPSSKLSATYGFCVPTSHSIR